MNGTRPPHIFTALGCTFDLDVAHPPMPTHVPCNSYISENSLSKTWHGFVWMNPPFEGRNGITPWLDKFIAHGNGIALTPDRTSAPWFQTSYPLVDAVMFTPKIKFIRPDGTEGKSPSNGTALFACGKQAVEALINANKNGLGIIGFPQLRNLPD